MANNINIVLTANPLNLQGIWFSLFKSGQPVQKTIFKQFSNSPVNQNQVQLYPTLAENINALYQSLVTYNTDSFCSYSLSDNIITIEFAEEGSYGFTKNALTSPVLYSLTISDASFPVIPAAYFPYKTFSIQIIDTYENERLLIEEFTQISSPKIKWDAGDDLYQNMKASELTFNMMVTDNTDAKFKHLFTGDEKRYLVKVFFVNESEAMSLCWQGFLLPDQFNEPYKNGVNFIEFTATDMIGSLKGKYLEPWFYVQRLPIAQLIASILQQTGLVQEILVKPSIVPATSFVQWHDINVNLQPYFDGKKYTDVYQILADVLEAQALTIYSYNGFWWLEGVTRKKDTNGTVLNFDADGNLLKVNRLFSKSVNYSLFTRNSPAFSGVTPWKAVNVSVSTSGDGNVYSDDVVKKELYLTTYSEDMESDPSSLTGNAYRDTLFKDWAIVGCPNMIYRSSTFRKFSEKLIVNFPLPSGSFTTQYTTAYALANYLKCPESPYLLADNEYEFSFEGTVNAFFATTPEVVQKKVDKGDYDGLFRFSLLMDGVSILNNIPELSSIQKFVYDRQVLQASDNDYEYTLKFKISVKFRLNVTGNAELRFLYPTFYGMPHIYETRSFTWTDLKVSNSEDYAEKENIQAVRPINFTQEYNADLKIISTVDYSVENSFGLGFPINQPPYLYTIPTNNTPAVYNDFQVFPTGISYLSLQTFVGAFPDTGLKTSLFVNDFRNAVFKEKSSGIKTLFGNLWARIFGAATRLGYLLSYTGNPTLPKTFYTIDTLEATDVLKYMEVKYNVENYANRAFWKIFGDNVVENYNRTFAKAIHSVQPETLYMLEGTALDLIFPDMLIGFYFDNENRQFIPTSLSLDLTDGKTQIVATENKYAIPNDISYE